MNTNTFVQPVNILIIGGGFAGVACARKLVQQSGVTVTLISNSDQFQYYPAIFRAFGSRNRVYSDLPLQKMLPQKCNLIIDKVTSIDVGNKMVTTAKGGVYNAEYIILCTGMQISYFDIPGMPEMALPLRTTNDAIHLTNHIDELFAHYSDKNRKEQLTAFSFVVVGGGPAGCEIAGEIILYAKSKAKEYGVHSEVVSVQILESRDRILSMMTETTSKKVAKRLERLGVIIRTNSTLIEGHGIVAQLSDENIETRTIVWSAGIMPTRITQNIAQLEYNPKGKIMVDEHLVALGTEHVYIAGDIAATERSGLAQTAIHDGGFVASDIISRIKKGERKNYVVPTIASIVPTGRGYGVLEVGGRSYSGYIGWLARAVADMGYYWSVLPLGEVIKRLRGIL